jgi:oligosaccharyltransferase complex subunit gamma
MKVIVPLLQVAVAAIMAAATAATDTLEQLTDLAAKGNGVIKLDPKTFEMLTSPTRSWSASVQLTALDARRRCGPCR